MSDTETRKMTLANEALALLDDEARREALVREVAAGRADLCPRCKRVLRRIVAKSEDGRPRRDPFAAPRAHVEAALRAQAAGQLGRVYLLTAWGDLHGDALAAARPLLEEALVDESADLAALVRMVAAGLPEGDFEEVRLAVASWLVLLARRTGPHADVVGEIQEDVPYSPGLGWLWWDALAREDVWGALIEAVARGKGRLSARQAEELRRNLCRAGGIRGFRDPLKAPYPLFVASLRTETQAVVRRDLLLRCWVDLNEEVIEQVIEAVEEGLETGAAEGDLEGVVDALRAALPNLGRMEAMLALAHLYPEGLPREEPGDTADDEEVNDEVDPLTLDERFLAILDTPCLLDDAHLDRAIADVLSRRTAIGENLRLLLGHLLEAGGLKRADPLHVPEHVLARCLRRLPASPEYRHKMLFLWAGAVMEEVILPLLRAVADVPTDFAPLSEATAAALPQADPETVWLATAALYHYRRVLLDQMASSMSEEPAMTPETTTVPGNQDACAERPRRFLGWLEEIAPLDPAAPEWIHVEWFATELRRLAELKNQQRRHRVEVARVEEALTRLAAHAEVLAAIGLSMAEWSAARCPAEAAAAVISLASEMAAYLEAYAQTAAAPVASPAENRAKLARLHELNDLIEARHGCLAAYLGSEPAAPAGPDGSGDGGEDASSPPPPVADEPVATPPRPVPVAGVPAAKPEPELAFEVPSVGEATLDKPPAPTVVAPAQKATTEPGETADLPQSEVAVALPEGPPLTVAPEPPLPAVEVVTLPPPEKVWDFLNAGDEMGAYWFSRALGSDASAPAWLLQALVAARWLARGARNLEGDLFALAQAQSPQPDDDLARALGVAAALFPALANPAAGTLDWLRTLHAPFHSVNPVIELVRGFVATGMPLAPEDVALVRNREALNEAVHAAVTRVRTWHQQAVQRKFLYIPAGAIFLRVVVAKTGPLADLLTAAAEDRRDEAAAVLARAKEKRQRSVLVEMVREAENQAGYDRKVRQVEGKALEQVIGELSEGLACICAWAQAARRWQVSVERSEWWQDHVERLVHGLRGSLPAARVALAEALAASPAPARGAGAALLRSLADLGAYVEGQPLLGPTSPFVDHGLEAGLAYRLLWQPGLPLEGDEYGEPRLAPGGEPALLASLVPLADVTAVAAEMVRKRLEQEDFRWLGTLLAEVPQGPDREALLEEVNLRRERARAMLVEQLNQQRAYLAQAVLEGSVDQDEKSRVEGVLEEVAYQAEGQLGDVGLARERLRGVEREIGEHRQRELDKRREVWAALHPSLAKILSPAEHRRLSTLVETALNAHNIYLLDELLPQVQRALSEGNPNLVTAVLPAPEKGTRANRDALTLYLAERDRLVRLLDRVGLADLEQAVRHKRPPEELDMHNLPDSRRTEVARALAAWRNLKQAGGDDRGETAPHVFALLNYLGFRLRAELPEALRRVGSGKGWTHWTAAMSAGPLAPVPQFGSARSGSYDVLCIWERPGMTTIEAIAHEAALENQPFIMVYLGRLLSRQWEDFARHAYRTGRQALVLDETLLVFLGREYESRLRAFFQCTLPAADVNPYVPYVAGNVPREMFFGRAEQVRKLLDRYGPAIVYGGRQLGKSSLLRSLQRDFHDPAKEQYSFIADIKHLGGPAGLGGPEDVWGAIGRGLHEAGLLKRPVSRPEKVEEAVRALMMTRPQCSVLVLLDEADDFLTADSKSGFAVVSGLKRLMDHSDRRFKVVFAGLHNVRRFSTIPNQPLAHLGTPIVIGPLDPPSARRLVCEPLMALGYRFADGEAEVLNILTLCNYHPGLLQLFCSRLVRYLRYGLGVLPPYTVTAEDVQAVYRDPALRGEIRDRFLWTLELDPRYRLLVSAMIYDQITDRNGFAVSYSVQDLHKLGADYWRTGFASLSPDHMRDYAQELTDLWVLAPAGEGRFRLRSPNLVRLIGPKEEIEEYLLPFQDAHDDPVDPWRDADVLHPRVREHPLAYSPLSQGQMRRLGLGKTGVTLVFGSEATGLGDLPLLLESLSGMQKAGEARYDRVDLRAREGRDLERALRTCQAQAPDRSLVCLVPLCGDGPTLARLVKAALAFAEGGGREARWLRLVLSIGPEELSEWLALPDAERREMEARCGAITLERWDERAVRRWLEESVPRGSGDAGVVATLTGGYHLLVSTLAERIGAEPSRAPGALARALRAELVDPASALGERFRRALGIEGDAFLRRLLAACAATLRPQELVPVETVVELMAADLGADREMVAAGVEQLVRLAVLERVAGEIRPPALVCDVFGAQ